MNCRLTRSSGQTTALSGTQLNPDLVRAVNLHVGVPDPLDMHHQQFIALGTGRAEFRIALTGRMAAICRGGDPQDLADRLDPVGITLMVDEGVQDFSRRSSSAWAKNALASLRISWPCAAP